VRKPFDYSLEILAVLPLRPTTHFPASWFTFPVDFVVLCFRFAVNHQMRETMLRFTLWRNVAVVPNNWLFASFSCGLFMPHGCVVRAFAA
jgi:hypothetical protein